MYFHKILLPQLGQNNYVAYIFTLETAFIYIVSCDAQNLSVEYHLPVTGKPGPAPNFPVS